MNKSATERQIEILWPTIGVSVTADLDGRNRDLADALWRTLPYRSLQGHALVAGHHLYHLAPMPELLHVPGVHKIDRRIAPDGSVFCSRLQHLGIKYGPLSEPMPATPIGTVREEDLDALAEAGKAVWQSVYSGGEPVIVEVRRAGDGGGHQLRRPTARHTAAEQLLAELHDEIERIWLDPPQELVDLHEGRIASGAGSFGTTLTTMLFVNGETRPLGYCCYSGLVRAAQQQQLPLEFLQQMARIMAATPAEFLGYCGLNKLHQFTERALEVADQLQDREDFVALMSHMALYVNCLGAWNLQLFPWQVDEHLRADGSVAPISGSMLAPFQGGTVAPA
ncbi:cucumopine synthase-related protein [Nonomuraea sp. NPDC004702]